MPIKRAFSSANWITQSPSTLKSLFIHFHCTTDEIVPNNLLIPIFKDLQLDSLKITFFSVSGAERILSFLLECFKNSKTLSIQLFGRFDIRMIYEFPILPMLKEISIFILILMQKNICSIGFLNSKHNNPFQLNSILQVKRELKKS